MNDCELKILDKVVKVPHFLLKDGRCKRCGQYFTPPVEKVKRGRFSGKSNSKNKFNDYK